jgi:hypothetical protein
MMNLSRILMFMLFFLCAYRSQANSTTSNIPNSFRGVWDINQESCNYKNSDSRIKIHAKKVVEDEGRCRLKRVTKSSVVAFSGIFACAGEGEVETREIAMQLIHKKLVGYYQGDGLIRCK